MHLIHREFELRELKLAGNDSEMTFSGYGAVFNNIDSYGDMIKPGAFAKSLSESNTSGQWPAMLLQHGGWGVSSDDLMPIGVWTEMAEDGHGLKISGKLADTSKGRDAYTLMKMDPRPAITGLSIGYVPIKWTSRSKPEDPRRTLEEIKLLEVSLVTFPANDKARVESVKSLDDMQELQDVERYLRDACGCSKSEATKIVAVTKSAIMRDAESYDIDLAAALLKNINQLRYSK